MTASVSPEAMPAAMTLSTGADPFADGMDIGVFSKEFIGSSRTRGESAQVRATIRPEVGHIRPCSTAQKTRVIQPCESGAVPCWMPSSASRTFMVTAPGSLSVTRNDP